ncbi:MAG: thioredoxin family protein [Gemmatimonadota bacterium]
MVRTPSTMVPLGSTPSPFSLKDTISGRTVSLSDFDDAPALLVMFICNHCPYVKHIRAGLADLGRELVEKGVGVVAISANDSQRYPQDGPEAMAKEAKEAGYPFPYLFDESQEVAQAYGAACTPDFFLFDGEGELVYRGQFDGSRPGNSLPVTGDDLRRAVERVLAGEDPIREQVPSVGCNIKWKPGKEPAYFGA